MSDQKYRLVVVGDNGQKLTYRTVNSANLVPLIEVLLANDTATVLVSLDEKED